MFLISKKVRIVLFLLTTNADQLVYFKFYWMPLLFHLFSFSNLIEILKAFAEPQAMIITKERIIVKYMLIKSKMRSNLLQKK